MKGCIRGVHSYSRVGKTDAYAHIATHAAKDVAHLNLRPRVLHRRATLVVGRPVLRLAAVRAMGQRHL